MKSPILHLIGVLMCYIPLNLEAQNNRQFTSPDDLFREGRVRFEEKNYAVAMNALSTFVRQNPKASTLQEAEYMLACSAYELNDQNRITKLRTYLDRYPDTPYANRIYALLASCYYYDGKYDEALALFNSSRLEQLADEERDDRTYELALCYMKVGKIKDAAIWFETLKASSSKYDKDCCYYVSYIRYTQKRYQEALNGFVPLQNDPKYGTLVPYYLAEIYLAQQNYSQGELVATQFLKSHPQHEYASEMNRVLGEIYYRKGDYHAAKGALETYWAVQGDQARRDALYMLGLSNYQTRVFSKAVEALGRVAIEKDALTQNANLHLGLSYLQLAEKSKARMAFEQAANSDADRKVKEQAAYNYALCLHETSFSAFGESVSAFENFLNEFPTSVYADKVSSYLVEVYMNTRSYEAALKSIDRITRPSRSILEAKQNVLFQLGTQSFANSNFDQSLNYLNRSIELGAYNAQTKANAYYWCGEAYYRLQRTTESIRDFNNFLQLTNQRGSEMYALAHYNLGYLAFQQQSYSRALDYFQRYVKLVDGNRSELLADAYNRLGDCYLNSRNFSEAKRYYSHSEALNMGAGDYAFYQMGLVAGLQRDYTGKITLLNRLIGKYPSSPYAVDALYEKGRAYVLLENNDQAIGSFRELLDQYPKSPISRKAAAEIGLLYYQKDDYEKAINAYKFVVNTYPGSEEARLAMRDLKSIYVDLNRVDEFAALASSMSGEVRFDADEQDSLTYVASERIYMRGRIEEAKSAFNRYLQQFPEGAFGLNAHYYLCVIASEQKNYDGVLTHSEKILAYPNSRYSEDVLVMRSEILFKMQRFEEALKSYSQLKEMATTSDHRLLAETGLLRSAVQVKDDVTIIQAASDLLTQTKLSPELKNEALYDRAKAYVHQKATKKAVEDWKVLAKDTRNLFGAEARYLVAQTQYEAKDYRSAEKELLSYIEQSTPHTYWLARSFVLLADVYMATGKDLDARQYLLSLQQNYQANDDIENMIETRLTKLKK